MVTRIASYFYVWRMQEEVKWLKAFSGDIREGKRD